MKDIFNRISISTKEAVALIALSLLCLTAQGAQPPGTPQTPSASPAEVSPEEDILDIRGPIHIPAPFPWIAWSAGGLAAAGIGLAAWVIVRRPRRKLPYEIALEKLAATRWLMDCESAQPFSIAVSDILRVLIEDCLPVRAAHRTTDEFLHALMDLQESPLAAHRDTLGDFLAHCDLAKFARWSLTRSQMEEMLTSASVFIIAIGKPASRKEAVIPQPASVPASEPVAAVS